MRLHDTPPSPLTPRPTAPPLASRRRFEVSDSLLRMKRALCALSLVLVVVATAGDAQAGGPWDHSGGTEGRFASAMDACKDQLGTGGAYEVVQATPADANGYSQCMVKEKGNASATPIYNGLVYLVNGQQPAPPPSATGSSAPPATASSAPPAPPPGPKQCDEKSDLGWFPSIAKSRLSRMATGDGGNLFATASAKPGSCSKATMSSGPRLFGNSNGRLRPDRVEKAAARGQVNNHFYTKVGDLIIDPTIFQFFDVSEGLSGMVFVGTERQLESTLNRLVKQCGPTKNPILKDAVAGKSGSQLKGAFWDGAVVRNSGDTIGPATGARGFEYKGARETNVPR